MSTVNTVERDLRLILDSVPALVNTVTPTGEIDYANRQLLDYLGVSLEQLQDWPRFIYESDRAMVTEEWQRSLESGQPFGADYRLRRSDGAYRWFHGHAVPVRAQDGPILRWCNLVTDIEERKQAVDVLRSSERQLNAIRSSGGSATWSIQTICRRSSLHASARWKRARPSKPSRACGGRTARIGGFMSGPFAVTTTMAPLGGTAFEPTSTTERLPKTR
jgi:PAS domain S-box-containing protein